MTRSSVVTLTLALACAAPSTALGDPPASDSSSAKSLHDSCRREFLLADYAAAVETCKQSFKLDGDPSTLYTIAQAYRANHQPAQAILFYEEFLNLMGPAYPLDKQAFIRHLMDLSRAEELAQAHEKAVAASAAPSSGPVASRPPAPAGVSVTPERTTTSVREPWYRDGVGDALLGTAAAGAIASGVLIVLARGQAADAAHAADVTHYQDALSLGQTEYHVALGVGAGAAVLLVAGATWDLLHAGHGRETQVAVTATGRSWGCTLTRAF